MLGRGTLKDTTEDTCVNDFHDTNETKNGEGQCSYFVSASFCEIYNEAVFDLLNIENRQLSIRWDSLNNFYAPDLYLHECPTIDEAYEVIRQGLRHRRYELLQS